MNFSIALYLHRGSASVYDFTHESLRDRAVLDLAARAGYEEVPENSEYAIRLELRDGRKLEAPFRYSRGQKPEPEALERRMEKFALLTRDRLNDRSREEVIGMVLSLDSVKDVSTWTAEIQKRL